MADKLSKMIREVGGTLSKSEAEKIAKKTGKSLAEVLAKADKIGIDIGSGTVKAYNKQLTPIASGPAETAARQALAPLEGLVIDPGYVYQGTSGTQNGSPIPIIGERSSKKNTSASVSSESSSGGPMIPSRNQTGNLPTQGQTGSPPAQPAGPDYGSFLAPFLQALAATTANSQQQMADLQAMMASGIANSQAMFQQQMEQNAALAAEEAAANRAFMINSGRNVSPANLQLGIGYNQNKLAGTEGFKYRPQRATSAPIAFSAPTLAASAASQVPTVINV